MEPDKEYYAFISYKREDEKWAKWLQHKLEHYRFPTNLNGRTDLPKNIRPTFRDMTDLTPGVLAEEIDVALHHSQWLIVVCSPRSAKSPWVGKEAQTFINLGRADHIIPFVIEGSPFSNEPAIECYPEALLNLTGSKELLAANINEMGRDAAVIKVVARMFGLKFDTLWRRYEREQRRKRWLIVAGSILLAFLSLAIGAYIARMNIQLDKANANLTAVNKEVRAERDRANSERDRAEKATDSLIIVNKEVLAERDRANSERDRAEKATNSLRTAYDSITRQNAFIQQQNAQLAEERDNVLRANWKMMENRARFVATKGLELIDDHDSYTAMLLALELLPESLEHPNKPYVVEAERLSRDAMRYEEVVLKVSAGDVNSVAFSPDGKLVALGLDTMIMICSASTGLPVIPPIEVYDRGGILAVAFSPDGKQIVSGSGDNLIRVWDVATGKHLRGPLLGPDGGGIEFIACSLDGRHVVTSDLYNTISVWNIAKETQVEISSAVFFSSIAFSPDGKHVVTGLCDQTIRLWDATTGKPIGKPLIGHTGNVKSVAFSPDGKQIVSGSADKTIRIWDVEKGLQIGEPLVGHKGGVNFVTFSPDGKRIVSGSEDKTIRVWDEDKAIHYDVEWVEGYTEGREIGEWIEDYVGGCCVAFGSEGKYINNIKHIVSGKDEEYLRVITMGKQMGNIIAGNPFLCQFSPDGKYIATTLTDETIGVWELDEVKKTRKTLKGHAGKINEVVFSPDSKRIASASNDKTIRIWDAASGKQMGKPLVGHRGNVLSVSFSPDGKQILSYSDDNTIRIWDAVSGKAVGDPLDGGNMDGSSYAVFSPDGKLVVSKSADDIVHIWNAISGKQIIKPIKKCEFVMVSADGNRVVSVSKFKSKNHDEKIQEMDDFDDASPKISEPESDLICVWDVTSGKRIGETINHHKSSRIQHIGFSYSGDSIIAVSDDGTIQIWEALNGRLQGEYQLEGYNGEYLDFSLGNGCAVAISEDGSIRFWDVGTGKQIAQSVEGIDAGFTSFSFSPNGKYILSDSYSLYSGVLYVWDAATGERVCSPLHLQGDINWSSFSPTGQHIVSGFNNRCIQIWDFPSLQDLIDETRKRFKDQQLTPEERRKYYLD